MKDTINILVVDDEQPILDFFERLLKMKGFGARTAKSGKEALESVANNNIHVSKLLWLNVIQDTAELCSALILRSWLQMLICIRTLP